MADTKISALTLLAATDMVNADELVVVDSSVAETKRATILGMRGAMGVAQSRSAATTMKFPNAVDAIIVLGYSSPGDGGGGLYVRSVSTPSHNGFFQDADSVFWVLTEEQAKPEMFGVVSGTASDQSSEMQDWIDYVESTGAIGEGDPASTYRVDVQLVVDGSDVTLIGNGATLDWRGGDAPIISVEGTAASRLENIKLRDWHWTGNEPLATGVRFRGVSYWEVSRCRSTNMRGVTTWITSDSAGVSNAILYLPLDNTVTTGAFTVGETVTGSTSGATGTVLKAGAGFVNMDDVVGTFQSGEVVTGGTSGETSETTSAGVFRVNIDEVVDNDCCQFGRVTDCVFVGNTDTNGVNNLSQGQWPGGITLHWDRDVVVSGCHTEGDRNGIRWFGGDANVVRDGDVGSRRETARILITNCSAVGHEAGGIWGTQGREVSVTNCTAERCNDIGIHGEGDLNCSYTGNVVRNCKNGCYTPYFVCENTVYSGNTGVMDDDTYQDSNGDMVLFKHNYAGADLTFDIRVVGNVFEMKDTTHPKMGTITLQRAANIVFESNTLKNVVIESGRNSSAPEFVNSGHRIIRNNHFLFTFDPGSQVVAILLGPNLPGADMLIENNKVQVTDGVTLTDDDAVFLRTYFAGSMSCVVQENWVDHFEIFALTESTTIGGSAHHVRFIRNLGTQNRKYLDFTNGVNVGDTISRHSFQGEMNGERNSALTPLYALPSSPGDPPANIVLATDGSVFPYANMQAGGKLMTVCITTGGVATAGTWSSGGGGGAGGDYELYDTVVGSDSAVHICHTASGSGTTDPAATGADSNWYEIAANEAVFKEAGAIDA